MVNIKEIINNTLNENAYLVLLGYSPTGGGHTSRTYNIIKEAIKNKKIKNNSTIIAHLPLTWENKDNSNLLKEFFNYFINNKDKLKLNIIMIKNNKPVYGYLKSNGGSDNKKIIERFAIYNKDSEKDNIISINNGFVFSGKEEICFDKLPIISSRNLIESLCNLIKEIDESKFNKILEENVYVLSDMAPDLIKAACNSNINKNHILDQQNHGILLEKFKNIKNIRLYDLGKYAYLSKILCGYGNKISHIELGDKNTLLDLGDSITIKKGKGFNDITIAGKKGKIISTNLKKDVIENVIKSILKMNNLVIDLSKESTIENFSPGIYVSKPINKIEIEKIDSIVSIYAHSNNNTIMNVIHNEIKKDRSIYENTIFIICGNTNCDSDYNLMHLSYLLDANFILTSGAGTSGEYLYLRNNTKNRGKLLLLPILGHEEQLENTNLLKASRFKEDILVCENSEKLKDILLEFLNNLNKYEETEETIDDLIKSIKNCETYTKQACDLLFEDAKQDIPLKSLEEKLQNELYLKLVRRFMKLIFISLDHLSKNNDKINIKMKNKDEYKKYKILDIVKFLSERNIVDLQKIFSLENKEITKEYIESLPGLALFIEIIYKKTERTKLIQQLQQELSNYFITGF